MRKHSNAFDLIRLVAASMVLWSHQHAVMGLSDPDAGLFHVIHGGYGVFIFFVVSGYLNTLSVIRHHSVPAFLISRGLRIYPALVVCIGFTVLVGACVAPDLRTYLDFKLLSFIGKDVTLFTGTKAGVSQPVFTGNVMPNALNGSVWTLTYEVKMYVVLALCLVALRYKPAAAIFVSGFGLIVIGFSALDTFWLQFSALFIAGSFVAAAQKLKNLAWPIVGMLLLSCLFAALGRSVFALYLVLTAAVITFGSIRLPTWLRPPLDLSYAIYLYAFPVQQLSAMLTKNFWIGLAFTATITVALALLSALLVEQPAQRWKLALGRRSTAAPAPRLAADDVIAASTEAETV
jgi:peptidoglycan/LPS O-acetylase OafA/YrhL